MKTRKDIFKDFGIEYDSKAEKILAPWNEYIPLPLKNRNSKVGSKAWAFSMTHGNETFKVSDFGYRTQAVMNSACISEIAGSCACHCDHCYCDSGCYNFDSTKASNMINLILARFYLDFLKRAILAQIKAYKITQIRIHASGDFLSDDYINMWKEIVIECASVIFWTYTKVEKALNAFQNLNNLSIVPSNTPVGINFGKCADLLKKYNELTEKGYKVHICACGTKYEKHCCDCTTGCKAIGNGIDFVLFILHSTGDYKAGEKDVDDFNKVVEIIKAQEN